MMTIRNCGTGRYTADMHTGELKPCPFCGSTDVDVSQEVSCASYEACEDCGAVIYRNTMKDAVDAWNRRDDENPEYLEDWDKRLSVAFSGDMHRRMCGRENSRSVYTVMREACAVLDWLLCEEEYHRGLTVQVREKLARLLRTIDGADEQV